MQNLTITDEQAKIIGAAIGDRLAQALKSSMHGIAFPVGAPSFTDKIVHAVNEGFIKIASAVRDRRELSSLF